MYVVNLIIDDEVVSTNDSHHPMRRTLRLAWELLGGIPQAECVVRRDGVMVAYLHTNFRGELAEAEIHTHRPTRNDVNGLPCGTILVTPLNPHGSIFAGVFVR